MTSTKVTKPQVARALREICTEQPDRINPVIDGSCVYTKGRAHCIVGQVADRLDLPMPKPRAGGPRDLAGQGPDPKQIDFGLWAGLVTDGAIDLLSHAQSQADNQAARRPRPWGETLAVLQQRGQL